MLLTKLETADTLQTNSFKYLYFLPNGTGQLTVGRLQSLPIRERSKAWRMILKVFFVAVMRDYGFESKQK
jgi:hypothetical protein